MESICWGGAPFPVQAKGTMAMGEAPVTPWVISIVKTACDELTNARFKITKANNCFNIFFSHSASVTRIKRKVYFPEFFKQPGLS